MVDVLGHIGMALIWLAPAWVHFESPKTAAVFVVTCAPFGMLPDVDLYLSNLFTTVHHHGVFHTIVVVTLLSAVIGPLLGMLLDRLVETSGEFVPNQSRIPATMWSLGVWIGSLSHLFADMLSAPDVAPPIEPLWPVYNGQLLHIDLVWFTSPRATWGLFAVGILLNAVLYQRMSRAAVDSP